MIHKPDKRVLFCLILLTTLFKLISLLFVVLYIDIVLKRLGSCAFDSVSQYRLSTWLSHQEDSHRIVFFVCDCQRVSAWNRICIRQADCILVLALHSSDPARPSPIEMALKNDPTKVSPLFM